jgi:hypothetical protein
MICVSRSATASTSTLQRYLGHQTIWYLQDNTKRAVEQALYIFRFLWYSRYNEDARHVSSWEVDREVAPAAESALIKQEDDTPR